MTDFWGTSHYNFIYSQCWYQKPAERKSLKKYFLKFRFIANVCPMGLIVTVLPTRLRPNGKNSWISSFLFAGFNTKWQLLGLKHEEIGGLKGPR